jgi:hypothetical protein
MCAHACQGRDSMFLGTAQAPAAAREAVLSGSVIVQSIGRQSAARTRRWRGAFRAVRSRTRNPNEGRRHAPNRTSSPTFGVARAGPRSRFPSHRTERCRFRFARGAAISTEVDQAPAQDDEVKRSAAIGRSRFVRRARCASTPATYGVRTVGARRAEEKRARWLATLLRASRRGTRPARAGRSSPLIQASPAKSGEQLRCGGGCTPGVAAVELRAWPHRRP